MSIEDQAARFFAEKRIAVVGVSRKKGTGRAIFEALRKRGLDVVPVNPSISEIEGEPCYTSVAEIPGGVGATVIATRPAVTEQVVRDCAAAGVAHVWLHYNALFGAKMSSVSDEAAAFCEAHGIAVISGGCPLMFGRTSDFGHRCMRWIMRASGRLAA